MATLVKAKLIDVFRNSRSGWLPLCNFLTQEYGRVVDLGIPFRKTIYISDSAVLHDLFVGQHTKAQRSQIHKVIGKVLGLGLITSEGNLWKRQRRYLQPLFTKKSVKAYEPEMVEIAKTVISRWPDTTNREPVPMDHLTFEYAVRVIIECILGKTKRDNWKELSNLLSILGECLESYLAQPILWPFWLPLPLNLRINRNAKALTQEIQEVILELEMAEPNTHGANLVQYLKSNPEQTAQQILDEIRTVFIAGHDTSASTLAWTCVLLAQNPVFQDELATEILSRETASNKDARDSPLLTQFILETLRLFPAAWSFTRKCGEEISTQGVVLPKGATLILDLFNSHRDPNYFDQPNEFNPKRFGPKPSDRPPYFMPFGAGPRICIGNNLAVAEMKIFIAELLRNYRVSLDSSYRHSIQGRTTLRPEFGLPIHLSRRK